MRTFLGFIEAAFSPLLFGYGFKLDRTVEASFPVECVDLAYYSAGKREIAVCYARNAEMTCDVSIKGYGGNESISDLNEFARGLDGPPLRQSRTDDPATFAAQAREQCAMLRDHCGDFLTGNLEAFKRKHRELLLVGSIRNACYTAYASGDLKEFERFDAWLENYWTIEDQELRDRAHRL